MDLYSATLPEDESAVKGRHPNGQGDHMRSIRMLGLAIAAVLAFSAITIANASGEEFIYSKTGKITGKAVNTQEFKTGTGATVDCTAATPEGEVTQIKNVALTITVRDSGCTISGIGKASFSNVLNTFFIPLLWSILTHPPIIFAKALGVECEIEIGTQNLVTGNSMTELNYVNKSPGIEIVSAVTKLASEIKKSNSTSLCGTVGEKKEGTYKGSIQDELEGGTMEVK